MVLDQWRFIELFALVGALVFGAMAGVQILGVVDLTTYIPQMVINLIPSALDLGTVLAGLALVALLGTALLVWDRLQRTTELPDGSLS